MNLRHIEVFHAVYVNGSISAAARALNVSQPSVSKVLRHAETRLGFPLFRRVRGRILPTEEAHSLFREVDELYGRMGSLKQTAKNLRNRGEGHIRLAVLPSLGLGVAPAAVAEFRAKHPGVTFDIQTLHQEEMLRSLFERECDLAVGYEAVRHPRLSSLKIGSGELTVLFRDDHVPAPPSRLALKDLQDQDFIGLTESGVVGDLFARAAKAVDMRISEVISVRTFYVAAALVRCGAGIAVVDEFTARASAGGDLRLRPLEPGVRFGVHCIFLQDHPPSRLSRGFIDGLSRVLTEGPPLVERA